MEHIHCYNTLEPYCQIITENSNSLNLLMLCSLVCLSVAVMRPRKVGCLWTMNGLNFPLHFVSDWVNSSCGSGRLVWQWTLQLYVSWCNNRL